ncbi:adenylyl-sulfate kinase 3-like [Durio zibethinus]|uniref:Adenylyl-sulfate kinase 3-like n=1 Tax=Durio zibethinus TaxID=66656 RepID=A0A6P5YS39_DURZI|nr:adenylyl-sulfate kinase 3-like [Durio zibethinus]
MLLKQSKWAVLLQYVFFFLSFLFECSGKSTLACSLSRELYTRGRLSYIPDGDNLQHGLSKDLHFKAEDRTENIRWVGEVASLISPNKKDQDACHTMLLDSNFIEARLLLDGSHLDSFYHFFLVEMLFSLHLQVFMNMPLELCEERDSKGPYKLSRAGKIKGELRFLRTFIDRSCLIIPFSSPCSFTNNIYLLRHETSFLLHAICTICASV